MVHGRMIGQKVAGPSFFLFRRDYSNSCRLYILVDAISKGMWLGLDACVCSKGMVLVTVASGRLWCAGDPRTGVEWCCSR